MRRSIISKGITLVLFSTAAAVVLVFLLHALSLQPKTSVATNIPSEASYESTQPVTTAPEPDSSTVPQTQSSTEPNSVSPSDPNTVTSGSISNTTSNWSGYAASGGTFSSVSGSWVVPSVSSSEGTASDATWVGIGGVSSDDLIQTGTENIITADGQTEVTAFYELLPDSSQTITTVNVSPGDSISASIENARDDQWTINVEDNTNGESFTTTLYYGSSESSAEWIEEDPSDGISQIPLDSFGDVTFTGASATENGNNVNLSSSNAQALTMVNNENQVLVTTSSVDASGSSFSVTRTDASSDDSTSEYGNFSGGWHRIGTGIGREGGSFTIPTL